MPVKHGDNVGSHGPGGRLPPSGCKASGKTRVIDPGPNCGTSYAFLITVSRCYLKNAEGEGSLSLAAFLRFHLARGDVWFVFLCIVRKQDCLIDQSPSQTGVQRRASSGAGVRGPQRPLLRLYVRVLVNREKSLYDRKARGSRYTSPAGPGGKERMKFVRRKKGSKDADYRPSP